MIPVSLIFYVFGALVATSGMYMVLTRNVLYAALSLLICLLSLAAIYVCLFADFVAIAQLMIYVGGVLVLIIFGIMLSLRNNDETNSSPSRNLLKSSMLSLIVLSGLLYLIATAKLTNLPGLTQTQPLSGNQRTTVYGIGTEFLTT